MKPWSKMWRLRSSITVQILFFMVLAAVVPLLVSNWIFIATSENMVTDHVFRLHMTEAENAGQWVLAYNTAIRNELEMFISLLVDASLSDLQKDQLLDIVVNRDNNIDFLWVRGDVSRIFSKADRQFSPQLREFAADDDLYHSVLAGEIVIGDPFVLMPESGGEDQALGDHVTVRRMQTFDALTLQIYALPLWVNGQPQGVLFAEVNLTPLRRYIADLPSLRHGSEIFIVDRHGHVIAHKDEQQAIRRADFSNLEFVQKMDRTFIQTQTVHDKAGKEMLANIRLIDEVNWGRNVGKRSMMGWGIVAQEPKEVAFFPIAQMSARMKGYGAIAVGIAVIIAGALAISIIRPIHLLTKGAERLAARDYDVTVNVRARNEIGLLAASFNAMTNQIRVNMAELKERAIELRELFFSSMETIVAAIDARDPYTRGHSLRVTAISVEIGRELGMDDEALERLRIAAMLHDVGKIGIRDEILLKNGKLTDDEFTLMKKHPVLGATIMGPIKLLSLIIPGMKFHHEWWNGTGYPNGLKGENIPFMARVIAVADTFDAMTSDRPYQKRMDPDYVAGKIEGWAGTRYDPAIVKAFLSVYRRGLIPDSDSISIEFEQAIIYERKAHNSTTSRIVAHERSTE